MPKKVRFVSLKDHKQTDKIEVKSQRQLKDEETEKEKEDLSELGRKLATDSFKIVHDRKQKLQDFRVFGVRK